MHSIERVSLILLPSNQPCSGAVKTISLEDLNILDNPLVMWLHHIP